MAQSKDELLDRLIAAMRDLPDEKTAEILDFADYLHGKYGRSAPDRGSAMAILRALDESGPLEFVPGELDSLLDEIERARDSDLDDRG
jgi:hypothetical protein